MAKVSVTKTIKAPAAAVWKIVSEWGGTHKWIPGVGPVSVEGSGVGSIRSADLDPATGFPGRISERLEMFDDRTMQFRYCVVGTSPIPISDYVAEMSVTATGDASCELTWSSTWRPDGDLSESELLAAFEGLYQMSLDNVGKALE
jgi:hypothetical protein